jgi:nucleotide-binding universal stress UspA family protein
MDHNNKNHKKGATETQSICNIFVVGIDGSEGSHNAVELVVKNFHRTGLDKTILVHISNTKKESEKGIQYHSKTIYTKYESYITEELKMKEGDYEFIFEERIESENVFEQINDIAVKKDATLLVLGFRGYKGTKNRPDELSKSVTYLVHKPKIPVLVVKEKTSRVYRQGDKFKWLVSLESAESKSFKALRSMLRYVDAEKDIIHGLTVDASGKDEDSNPVKKAFMEEMVKLDIKNSDFSVIARDDKAVEVKSLISDWIEEHLKNENHFIDFVVLGYNPSKYAFNKEAPNTTVDLLKTVSCNVFFDH